jgi:glutamine cyclotransferase
MPAVLGQEVEFDIHKKNENIQYDSVLIFRGQTRVAHFGAVSEKRFSTADLNVGNNILKFLIYHSGKPEVKTRGVRLLSDVTPKEIAYEVVNTFPHDQSSFTQGLVYSEGFLYEGTGQFGQSALKKIDLETGKVKNQITIPREFFGEGIAIYHDKIFQLTWKAQVGFIYDKSSFRQIDKIYYDIREGWGLTFNGQEFIMSDGTANLYFVNPEYFTPESSIEVYDDKGMVTYLNELEYIDNMIYANIWGEKKIAIINPESGKVTGYIDCNSLVPKEYRNSTEKVLNGIAYNPENGHIYLTGKYWNVLYEIRLKN